MEVSWINTRLGYGETVENLWNICGKTDMKKLWNQHAGKLQTGKYQRRATME